MRAARNIEGAADEAVIPPRAVCAPAEASAARRAGEGLCNKNLAADCQILQ